MNGRMAGANGSFKRGIEESRRYNQLTQTLSARGVDAKTQGHMKWVVQRRRGQDRGRYNRRGQGQETGGAMSLQRHIHYRLKKENWGRTKGEWQHYSGCVSERAAALWSAAAIYQLGGCSLAHRAINQRSRRATFDACSCHEQATQRQPCQVSAGSPCRRAHLSTDPAAQPRWARWGRR